MNSFERSVLGEIPLVEASEYFIKLKYGSAGPRHAVADVMEDFASLSTEEQAVICKEAGVSLEEAAPFRTSVKTAAVANAVVKKAYAEKMLPGTEGYYSDRMRSMLEGLEAKVYTPEGVDYTTVNGEKLASAFKLALEQTPNVQEYLSREQEAMAAQEQNEVGFMRQRMEQMQQQSAMAQQGQQATSAQMAQLEQQIADSQAQIQAAQQSAMNAQSMASQAQQSQLSATDESMRNAQLAAQMRMAYQQLRSQMMDIASQDPAAGLADQLKGQMPGQQGLGPEGVSMGQPPSNGPAAPEAGPAGQAPGAQAAPDAAPPEGETGGNTANANSKPPMEGAAPSGFNGMKQASAMGDMAMGALGGAAVGAAGTQMMDVKGTDKARQRLAALEQQQGGFVHALNIAQSKARVAMGELAEKHPVGATVMGSLMGASTGAALGPAVRNLVSK